MKTRIMAALLAGGICAFSLFPALPVIDVAAITQLINQINWLTKQYNQLVTTYNMIKNQYDQMVLDAKMITSKAKWKAILSPWKFPTATNTYGTTSGWMGAVNSGAGAAAGYLQAAIKLQDYGSVWASLSPSSQDRISRDYATLELADGTSINSISMLGTIRGNTSAVENAITLLENDSLSDAPDLNTEVGVLNKINATALIAVRNSQDTNKLLASVLEQDLVETKARRDAAVQSINNDLALRQMTPVLANQHLSGTTAVLTTYRLP